MPSERVCQLELFSPLDSPRPAAVGTARKETSSPGLEDLGKQSIGGLETVGTRETMVIPTGAIGNNSPLLAKQEYWYSSRLGVNLISKRQDPRFGVQNFEVTDIALGEPDVKLFAIPSGSKILDLRKPPEISSPQAATPN